MQDEGYCLTVLMIEMSTLVANELHLGLPTLYLEFSHLAYESVTLNLKHCPDINFEIRV